MSSFNGPQTINSSFLTGHAGPYTFNNIGESTITITVESITLSTASQYFVMGSNNIIVEGGGNTVNITATNHPGIVDNSGGNTGITIQNIACTVSSGGTLHTSGGWICQANAVNGTIINCYSTASISSNGGGIAGAGCSNVTIESCYSTGNISSSGGGIAGSSSNSVSCTNCFSIGTIASGGGGIIGGNAENSTCTTCYSLGTIATNGGGIIGTSSTGCIVSICYSQGTIGSSAGGIIGNSGGTPTITNCYSSGTIGTSAGGIIGASSTSNTISNCYTSGVNGSNTGGIVSGSSSDNPSGVSNCYSETNHSGTTWTDAHTVSVLTISNNWISTATNTPYYLQAFNAQLYSPNSYIQTTSSAYTTSQGLFQSNFTYSIISIQTNYSSATGSISISSATGVITFPTGLSSDVYTVTVITQITLGNSGYNYNINTFIYTESVALVPPGTTAYISRGSGIIIPVTLNTQNDLNNYLAMNMAYGLSTIPNGQGNIKQISQINQNGIYYLAFFARVR